MNTLIIGIGNKSRGDDGAGLEAARRLRSRAPDLYDISETDGEPTKLLDLWEGYRDVIAIDAVVTGQVLSGTIYCWDVSTNPLPAENLVSSSHALGLSEAIELARILDRLPPQMHVIGIEAASFAYCESISPAVDTAVNTIVETLSKKEALNARIFLNE